MRGPHHPIILHSMFLHAAGGGTEGGRINDLPRPLAKPTQARYWKKLVHCTAIEPPGKKSGTYTMKYIW